MRRTVVKSRSGKRRRLLYMLLLVGILVALAPTLAGLAGLHNRVLQGILPPEAGALRAAGATFGWFSPTELRGLQLVTPDGEVLLETKELTLDRTVLHLLRQRGDLGPIRVLEPILHLDVRETSSNVEEFVDRLLASRDEQATPLTGTFAVSGGSVHVVDALTGRETTIAIEQLTCELAQSNMNSLRAELTTSLSPGRKAAPEGSPPGRLDIALTTRADASCQLDVSVADWPIQVASSWLRRWMDEASATGSLTAQSTTLWTAASAFESSGTATLADLQLAAADLSGDRVRLAQVRVPWKINSQGEYVTLEEVSLASDAGELAIGGQLPLPSASPAGAPPQSAEAFRVPLTATGSLDLAKLAAMLPNTLQIRDGVTVDSGRAEFSFESRPAESAHRWFGAVTVSDLAAREGERSLRWQRPVAVAAAVRHDGTWRLESLTCQSDFLHLAAEGDWQRMTVEVDFDLARLASELGRFVDVGRWELGGRGSLRAQWRPEADGPLRASVNGSVNGLRWVDTQGRLWQESFVQLQADAIISLPAEGRPLTFERGSHVTLNTTDDRAFARLEGPYALHHPTSEKDGQPVGPASVEVEGSLAAWQERLLPWLDVAPWRGEGTAKLTSHIELRGTTLSAQSLHVELTDLRVVGPGWRIVEPRVTLQTSGTCDLASWTMDLGETTLVGSAASLRARDTRFAWTGSGTLPRIRGEAAFRAALERIDAWRVNTDGRPAATRPAGTMTGSIRVGSEAEGLTSDLNATVTDLAIYKYESATGHRQAGYRPAWQEPKLELVARTVYRHEADEWSIEQAALRSRSLAAAVVGSISAVSGPCDANLRGTIEYDLADVGPVVAAWLGLDVRLAGREKATFELTGPLRSSAAATARMVSTQSSSAAANLHWSQRLRGKAAAGWESIHFFGLPIGRGRLDAQLYDGRLTFAPLKVPVGPDGRLTASAEAMLMPPHNELRIPRGPIVEGVEITPEVSEKLLKYFVPTLADAIETQGKFSLATDGGRVPLTNLAAMESSGTLTVHAAAVRPGRIGREWILLAEQIEALLKNRQVPQLSTRPQRDLLTMNEQEVAYRIANGRVYHEHLLFMVGDIEVRSRGSVGFDETLALEVEIPVQDKWIADNPHLAAFRGRSIRGTIRGTFDKLDYGTLISDLTQQIGQGVIEGALEHELNRALDQLFRPRE